MSMGLVLRGLAVLMALEQPTNQITNHFTFLVAQEQPLIPPQIIALQNIQIASSRWVQLVLAVVLSIYQTAVLPLDRLFLYINGY